MYCKESRRADQRMAVPVNGSELWRHVLFYVLNLRTNRTPGLVDYVVLHIEEDGHLGTVGRAVWPSLRCSETPMGFHEASMGKTSHEISQNSACSISNVIKSICFNLYLYMSNVVNHFQTTSPSVVSAISTPLRARHARGLGSQTEK